MEDKRLELEIDRIKEVLNKKLPQEEIEKKLKNEIKKSIEKEDTLKIDENISTKPKENKTSINFLIYLFSFISLLLLCFAIYLFTKNEKEFKTKIVKSKPEIIIKEIEKEKIITKIVDLKKDNFKKYYNAQKFNILKCYDYKANSKTITSSCKKMIKEFYMKNKDSLRFELTPVVSKDDIDSFKELSLKDDLNELLLRGLSNQRVSEASFYIKEIFGEDIIINSTNYYVKSLKNNRGIILKAYFVEE